MIKEKIDRQKAGQSSATPFMWVNDSSQSSDRVGKRGVTFDAIETLERHGGSVDKLTLLVSKMNVRMDRRDAPIQTIGIGLGTTIDMTIGETTIGLRKDKK